MPETSCPMDISHSPTVRFLTVNHDWLNTMETVTYSGEESIDTAEDDTSMRSQRRPRKFYGECSKRKQQRKGAVAL